MDQHADPSNYRPITLLSIPYKIYCSLINIRLVNYLESNNIISSQQSGFRNGKQTTDNRNCINFNYSKMQKIIIKLIHIIY